MTVDVPGRMSIGQAREQFAVSPGYLDTATVGVPPNATLAAMHDAIRAWQTGAARPTDYDGDVTAARESFARLCGVPASDVCVGAQASALVGMVAASLPDGARVVTAEGDFTSLLFPFLAHADRGIETITVPLERLADSVDARTHLVAVSAVQSANGAVADLDALVAAAGQYRTRTLIDTTQATGWLPIDAARFDVTVCTAYKWLLSPRGTAFMTVRPDLLATIRPINAGWYAGQDIWSSIYGTPLRLASDARRLDVSPAWLNWVGTVPALDLIERVGVPAVHAHNLALADHVRDRLDLPSSSAPSRRSAILRVDAPDAAERLVAAGIRASVRAGAVRLSFHLYNTLEDAEHVAEVLAASPSRQR